MLDQIRANKERFFTRSSVVAIFLLSLASFLILYYVSSHPIISVPQFIFGLLALAVIPGSLVNDIILPKRMQAFWTSALTGIVILVLEIQVLFTLSVFLGIIVPLVIWLTISSLAIVFTFILASIVRKREIAFEETLSIKISGDMKLVLIVAIILRVVMLFFSQESLAPDACLYSDYARNILSGNFVSTIVNEPGSLQMWNGIEFFEHQAFMYVTSVSFVLFPPLISGPAPFLTLIGVLLIFPVYRISRHHFGEFAGITAAAIVAIHPLFVFHSTVAYGPEITSLLIALYGFILLFSNIKPSYLTITFAGLLVGIVDSIWYSNFYLMCAIIPIYALLSMRKHKHYKHLPLLLLPTVLISRAFLENLVLFFSCWIILFLVVIVMTVPKRTREYKYYLGFYASMLVIWVFYRWPVQGLIPSTQLGVSPTSQPLFPDITSQFDHILTVLTSTITLELVISFSIFLVFHLSVGVILVLFASLLKRGRRFESVVFIVMLLVASFGTLFVFAILSSGKVTLIPIYVYSDSRFFISITLLAIIALSRYFGLLSSFNPEISASINLSILRSDRKMRRQFYAFLLIVVGLIPSYIAIPSGLALINATQRYAWVDMRTGTQQLGDSDTIFFADRFREFSWITERHTYRLRLSGKGISNNQALFDLKRYCGIVNADYVLVDLYTVVSWRTLDILLYQSYEVADSIPLETELLHELDVNTSVRLPSAILEFQTPVNYQGDYSRIFSFGNSTYEKTSVVDLWDSGWAAGNDGSFVNMSGDVGLAVGSNQNYTYTWRPGEFDLDLVTNPGFTLIEIEETNATVSRIALWDTSGNFMLYAESLGNGLFYSPIGHASVGDIRITIEGDPNSLVSIEEISFWQQQE